jgi:hypothetical protein
LSHRFAAFATCLILLLESRGARALVPVCELAARPCVVELELLPLAVDNDIAISTTVIDFGQVNVGSTAQVSVTLTNTGGDPFGPLNMFGGAPPSAEFNASQSCQGTILPAGGSCQVSYAFSPGTAGVFDDVSSFTVSETPNQSDGEDFSVRLAGIGFDPDAPQPVEPEPAADSEPTTASSLELAGSAKVKGEAFKTSGVYSLQLSFDTAARTFLATDADGTVYAGNLAPKGQKGHKFALFLDDGSRDALSADVAARGAAASGLAPGSVLGESSKLTLRIREDGSASLEIKGEVLVAPLGRVVFKARLAGAAREG